MKIQILKNKRAICEKAAFIVADEIRKNTPLVLGLATGRTMIPFYKKLVLLHKKRGLDFSKVKTFNLDEYAGLNATNPQSFRSYMNKHLFNKVNIKEENINFLDGKSRIISLMCKQYELKIRKAGGINIQILGIGENGHIGFNEPGSKINDKTRKIKISDNTRKNNSYLFNSIKKVPKYAVTLGIKNILQARKIILLASGNKKIEAVRNAVKGPISESVPASFLQRHKNVLFIVDKVAASKLEVK